MQELHFVSAPHTLPLQDGQSIPMRAWWRHWNIGTTESANETQQQQSQHPSSDGGTEHKPSNSRPSTAAAQQPPAATAGHRGPSTAFSPFCQQDAQSQEQQEPLPADEPLPDPLVQQLQRQPSLLHGQARQEEISTMMAAGWEAVVLKDWAVSLQHLTHVWTSAAQEFDGVLGFSNGAAATFLFAAHAAAHPETFGSMRFVALAGGYVPEPLEKLLHPSLLAASTSGPDRNGSSVAPVSRLKAPLPFPSLHMMGSNDPLIDVDVATQLMECFQTQGRSVELVVCGQGMPWCWLLAICKSAQSATGRIALAACLCQSLCLSACCCVCNPVLTCVVCLVCPCVFAAGCNWSMTQATVCRSRRGSCRTL